jgi:hypothetical protein
MVASINASTSAGVVTTADTSGILQLQTASTAALTIDASQRVLIGTTSASYGKLVISGASADVAMQIADTASTTAGIGFNGSGSTNGVGAPTGTLYFGQYNGFPMVFTTNNAERVRIDSSGGNLLVGTTSTPSGATGSIVANNASYIGSNKVVKWTKTNTSNNVTTATVVFQTTGSWFTNYISFIVSCVQANSANNFAASYLYQVATLDASGGSVSNVLAQGDNAQFTVTVTGNSGTGTQTWTVSVTGPATVNRMILTLEAGSAVGINATA